jgi:hypothetical protein
MYFGILKILRNDDDYDDDDDDDDNVSVVDL